MKLRARPRTIKMLIRQAARWTTAAQQDQNELIAMLHANYGMAYMTAARQIASDMEIASVAGVDANAMEKIIADTQDWALRRFAAHVPQLVPDTPLMQVYAGVAA